MLTQTLFVSLEQCSVTQYTKPGATKFVETSRINVEPSFLLPSMVFLNCDQNAKRKKFPGENIAVKR